MGVRKLF